MSISKGEIRELDFKKGEIMDYFMLAFFTVAEMKGEKDSAKNALLAKDNLADTLRKANQMKNEEKRNDFIAKSGILEDMVKLRTFREIDVETFDNALMNRAFLIKNQNLKKSVFKGFFQNIGYHASVSQYNSRRNELFAMKKEIFEKSEENRYNELEDFVKRLHNTKSSDFEIELERNVYDEAKIEITEEIEDFVSLKDGYLLNDESNKNIIYYALDHVYSFEDQQLEHTVDKIYDIVGHAKENTPFVEKLAHQLLFSLKSNTLQDELLKKDMQETISKLKEITENKVVKNIENKAAEKAKPFERKMIRKLSFM